MARLRSCACGCGQKFDPTVYLSGRKHPSPDKHRFASRECQTRWMHEQNLTRPKEMTCKLPGCKERYNGMTNYAGKPSRTGSSGSGWRREYCCQEHQYAGVSAALSKKKAS